MTYLTVGTHKLFFETALPNTQTPALLLIHGAGGSHLDWPVELRQLPNTAVTSLDLPGHGRSTPPGHNSIEAYADIVQTFIKKLRLNNVVVAGHSMGGAIAQALALRNLAQLSGLVLVGTGARLPVSPVILEKVRDEKEFETAVSLISRYAWRKESDPTLRKKSYTAMLKTDSNILYGDFLACNQFDSREQLRKIRLPTLIISATKDKMMPTKFGQHLAEQIPNAEYKIIEDSGHFIQLEQSNTVSNLITDFLAHFS